MWRAIRESPLQGNDIHPPLEFVIIHKISQRYLLKILKYCLFTKSQFRGIIVVRTEALIRYERPASFFHIKYPSLNSNGISESADARLRLS